MKYIASRLSEGNKIFPAEIHIEENGIKVKIPGFLSGDTKFIDYGNISGVDINTPMIGYSSITLFYHGSKAYAHGFMKDEVKQIKQAIDEGKVKAKITTVNNHYTVSNPEQTQPTQQFQQQPISQFVQEPQKIISNIPVANEQNKNSINLNDIYSNQLEKLIEIALADGELSEKEKQILFKKAEAEGIDLDEFEMVLDSKLYEKNKNKIQEIPVAAPKSDKFGDVKKCPSCGAIIQSFQTKCTDCGHEISNIGANVSIQKLFVLLNEVENQRKDDGNNIVGAIFGQMTQQLGGGDKITLKKKSIISGFPIPNTKDDILEFLSTALPNAKQKGNFMTKNQPEYKSHNDLAPTWFSKCEQIVMKARFSMKEDKRTLEEINSYAKEIGIK